MKSKRLNNAGFTLVEIILAIGISSFIILAAYMMMNSASRSFSSTSEDIDAQRDVQQGMNFLYDKLSEAKNFRVIKNSFSNSGGTQEGLILAISNTEYIENGGVQTVKDITTLFVYIPNRDNGNLYYVKMDQAYNSLADSVIITRADSVNSDAGKKHLLAENVQKFSVTPAVMVANSPATVSIMIGGLKTKVQYSETKTIYTRNYVPTATPEP